MPVDQPKKCIFTVKFSNLHPMRTRIFLPLLLLVFVSSHAQQLRYQRIKFAATTENILILKSLSVAAEEIINTVDDSLCLETDIATASRLRQAGLIYTITIADLSRHYASRNPDNPDPINRQTASSTGLTPVPEGFELGSMGGFCTHNQLMNHLDTMRARYPHLITAREPISLTTTHDGNLIYSVKISDNPDVNESEPAVLFTGLTHAREPIGMQQMLFFMYHLLENYETDEYIRALIDTTQIVFVPCVNPDGYIYNQQTNPGGGGLWRKNRLDHGDGSYGVDLNRNFGFKWGYDDNGSSPNPASDTYRGAEAFSEPETRALRDFVNQNEFRICLNYHSHSNLLLFPFGYETIETPDSVTFHDFAQRMTAFNGYSAGTAGSLLYNTNGDANDWMYGDDSQHPAMISMTPEVGNSSEDGFWPQVDRIIPLCQENVPANLRVIELAGRYAEATDESPMHLSEEEGYLHYSFVCQGLETQGSYTVSYSAAETPALIFGNPRTYINPLRYDTIRDSIWYKLTPNSAFPNQALSFALSVTDGYITRTDTLHKIIGHPLTTLFSDPCNNKDYWTSPNWNVTGFYAHSPTTSLTDSPVGNYPSNANRSIVLTNNLTTDPAKKPFAMLSFWLRRDVQRGRDYVLFEASDDNGLTWRALGGKESVAGGAYQSIDAPLYEGVHTDWKQEEISLHEFAAAAQLKLRFTLRSDGLINRDGFWFDDLSVLTRDIWLGNSDEASRPHPWIEAVWPNPASREVQIRYALTHRQKGSLSICNTVGQLVASTAVAGQGETTISLLSLPAGSYTIILKEETGKTLQTRKLIVF